MSFNNKGFTLPQLIISMLVLLVMAAFVFIWIDPLARIGATKNTKRTQDVGVIAAALFNYAKEHNGAMPVLGAISTTKKVLCANQSGSNLTCNGDSDLCLTIDDSDFYKYLAQLPWDPDKSSSDDTGYYLNIDSNDILTVGACSTYDSATITRTLNLKNTCTTSGGPAAFGGGYCWHMSATHNIDCDDVCSALGLDCIRNASYGPDIDTNGDPFCRLHKDLGNTCPLGCGTGASSTPPLVQTGGCSIPAGSGLCSYVPSTGNYAICACE